MSLSVMIILYCSSGFRVPRGERRRRERRRFLLYCLYGFGMPAVLTSIVALMQFHPHIPDHHIKPRFTEVKCWFKGNILY